MKLEIIAIKDYEIYAQALQNYKDDSQMFDKPSISYIKTTANVKDENIIDYFIVPGEATEDEISKIEVTINNGVSNETLKCNYTKKLEEELDKIIEISNIKWREDGKNKI